jgi:hypothetical protein
MGVATPNPESQLLSGPGTLKITSRRIGYANVTNTTKVPAKLINSGGTPPTRSASIRNKTQLMANAQSSTPTNHFAWRDRSPSCARKVYTRLPTNCTKAPARRAGKRAKVGAMPARRMQVEKIEKSTSVAPLPTTIARPKRNSLRDRGCGWDNYCRTWHTWHRLANAAV